MYILVEAVNPKVDSRLYFLETGLVYCQFANTSPLRYTIRLTCRALTVQSTTASDIFFHFNYSSAARRPAYPTLTSSFPPHLVQQRISKSLYPAISNADVKVNSLRSHMQPAECQKCEWSPVRPIYSQLTWMARIHRIRIQYETPESEPLPAP